MRIILIMRRIRIWKPGQKNGSFEPPVKLFVVLTNFVCTNNFTGVLGLCQVMWQLCDRIFISYPEEKSKFICKIKKKNLTFQKKIWREILGP